MDIVISFICGCFAGGFVSLLIMALAVAAGNDKREGE